MSVSIADMRRTLELKAEIDRRVRTNRLRDYKPYPKQAEFHAILARERCLIAGNQVGKTWAAGFEVAMHLTGNYPDWWQGKHWDRPVICWAASETMEVSRDASQRILLGREGNRGEGAIPLNAIQMTAPYPNVKDAVSLSRIKHVSGGFSTVVFKSYDQGRKKFQGDTIDIFWPDEEPPEDIYFEGMTRTNATGGIVMMTFTPLLGMSSVVKRFLLEKSEDRRVIHMTIEDAAHYSEEDRARITASYPEHEREARTKGIPVMGSGRVFPITEASIVIDPIPLLDEWPRIAGIDFGWDHPTAGAWLAWDRDNDVVYLYADYSLSKATPTIHASAFRKHGQDLPIAWPHDGLQHDKGSGEQLAQQYRDEGLKMLPERATFENGTSGVEAGITEMLQRMESGRFKVFRYCHDWLAEFRMYHRKDGLIVKLDDDCISASRYALMELRHAETPIPKQRVKLNFRSEFAHA